MSDRSRIDNVDHAAAITNQYAADYRAMFSVIFGLAPFKDGNMWCVLHGDDLQSGITGFGENPYLAMAAFDIAMRSNSGSHVIEPKVKP
jgi:hypothetical protein